MPRMVLCRSCPPTVAWCWPWAAPFSCSALGDMAGGHRLEQLHKLCPVSAMCRVSVHIIKDHSSDPENVPSNIAPALLVSISVLSTRILTILEASLHEWEAQNPGGREKKNSCGINAQFSSCFPSLRELPKASGIFLTMTESRLDTATSTVPGDPLCFRHGVLQKGLDPLSPKPVQTQQKCLGG